MPREIGGSSFSTAAALCTIGGHWTDICPSDWATYKIRPLHKFAIVCQHFFPLFNSGIRHSVDRIIDTLIEQLLLRGRRDVNEAWISMPGWKSVSLQSISWKCISWQSISWKSIPWQGVSWQSTNSRHLVHLSISDR